MKELKNIKLFVTDCDGVLTDGGMYYFDNGITGKKFNCHDGEGFNILKKNKVQTAIISGDNSKSLELRNSKLKCDFLIMGSKNKLADLKKICLECNIELSNVLYVGDDLNDIEVMQFVGFSCCPHDALDDVKKIATFIADTKGGLGVIREIVNKFFC